MAEERFAVHPEACRLLQVHTAGCRCQVRSSGARCENEVPLALFLYFLAVAFYVATSLVKELDTRRGAP